MFTFLALLPTLQTINTKSVFEKFSTKFQNNYKLKKISESEGNIKFELKFTDEHIKVWLKDWMNLPGSKRIVQLIKLDHIVELNESGLVKIECGANDDYRELERHYVIICSNISLTFKDLSYKPALVFPENDARIFYTSGLNIDLDILLTSINLHLTKFFNKTSQILKKHVSDAVVDAEKRFRPLMDKFSRKNSLYNVLSELIAGITSHINYFRIVIISIERVFISNTNNSIRTINNNIHAMLDFFQDLIRSIEMVFRTYSDYIGISGVFATLFGIGASIILVAFTMPTDLLKWTSLGVGIGLCVTDTVMWLKAGIRDLVLKELKIIADTLT